MTSLETLVGQDGLVLMDQAVRRAERLHLRTGRANAYAALLPWSALSRLLTLELLDTGQVQTLRDGQRFPLELLTEAGRPRAGRHRLERLHASIQQGVSIVVNKIGTLIPHLGSLERMIERHFRSKAVINAYISFVSGSAFAAHWDDHDVLVLQVSGRKRWKFYGQTCRYPIKDAAFLNPGRIDREHPEEDIVVEAGDLIFIPRGDVHWTQVASEDSIHLSIGLTPPRGDDVLRWLAHVSTQHEFARKYIHPFASSEELAVQSEELKAGLLRLIDQLDLGCFLADCDRRRSETAAPNLGIALALGPETRVVSALRRRISLRKSPQGDTQLQCGDGTYTLSPDEIAVFERVQSDDSQSIATLSHALPQIDVVAAVRKLVAKGMTEIG